MSVNSDISKSNSEELGKIAADLGADLFGVAELSKLRGIFAFPPDLLKQHTFGMSIGVSLEKFGKYNTDTEDEFAFPLLQEIAERLRDEISARGFRATVVEPDKRVERESPLYWRGEISHKAIAKTAGLGWLGKSMLLITPEFGPRVCLATVLTDMPLEAGGPMKSKCGRCELCIASCPVSALTAGDFEDHPEEVERIVDIEECDERVERTSSEGVLCFECILACPWGKSRPKR